MKKIIILLLIVLLSALVLTGCNAKGDENNMDINKINFMRTTGDTSTIEMYVLTSDYTVSQYVITPYAGSHFDLFAGQLSSEEEYAVSEWQISEESWNSVVDTLNRNDFIGLPQEISCPEQVCDASSYYIAVETTDAVHRTGGYNAGQATDSVNKRFKNIMNSIEDII